LNQKIINYIKIILPISIGLILVVYSFSKISIDQILFYLKNSNYYWILIGIFFGSLSHISRSYRWNYLLSPLGYKITFLNSFFAVFSAYLINYTIPRAGDVARATIISKYENIPFDKTLGTIIAERIADLICAFTIICIAIIIKKDFILNLILVKINSMSLTSLILVLITFISFFLLLKYIFPSLLNKINLFFSGISQGILAITKMKHRWKFIFHTIFIWLMYVLMFYVTTLSMQEFHDISFAPILIGFILGMFSIGATNGGIGTYPEAIVIAFSLFSIAEDPSRAFGWIMWSSQTLMIIVFGGISLLLLPVYNKHRNKTNK
jgi:uncharacterized protein (TIRG00374 family)|tara:strand:+ start:5397 stop:6362 length:966 start_codon:yes stop_codon:yes gene_type:complete